MTITPDVLQSGGAPQRRLTAAHATASALVEAASLAEATPRILQAICEAFGWAHGAMWTVVADQQVLRCTDIWTTPGRSFPDFDAMSRTASFAAAAARLRSPTAT